MNCESEGEISSVERRWVIMCGRSVCPVWYGQKHLYTIQQTILQLILTTTGFCFPLTSSFTLLPAISLLEIPAGNHAFFLLTILLEVLCFWRTVQLVRPCVVVIWLFSLRHTLKICSTRDDDCICTRKSTACKQNTLPLL